MSNYEFHELAHLFPMMGAEQHAALVADIKAHGLLHPIVTYQDKIIDGRNRLRACAEAGVEPRFADLPEGVDPLRYVVSTNFTRRHLSESQRALAAARIEQHGHQAEEARKQFKVSKSALKQAELLLKHGTEPLIQAVEEDRMPVKLAAEISAMPADAQHEAVSLKPTALKGLVKQQKRLRQNARLQKATAKAAETLGHGVYNVLLADPPWQWEPWSEAGKDRSAENHYPVMDTASIAALQVPAAKDAVLFLWATGNMIEHALSVMKAWGFEYKSQLVWAKDKAGTGYWVRTQHELLLIGTRGHIAAPAPEDRIGSVIHADVGEHSAKPPIVHELIESWYPDLPKIELFAREHREGWTVHGAEVVDLEDNEHAAAA